MNSLNWEINQQRREELMREAQQRNLARIAKSGDIARNRIFSSLLYRTGRQLITFGQRLQDQPTIYTVQPTAK